MVTMIIKESSVLGFGSALVPVSGLVCSGFGIGAIGIVHV